MYAIRSYYADEGKNWLGTRGISRSERAKSVKVAAMVNLAWRILKSSNLLKPRMMRASFSFFSFLLDEKNIVPITGAKITATTQDARSAMETTAKSEKVYRITSYNVCYTKLLRAKSLPTRRRASRQIG